MKKILLCLAALLCLCLLISCADEASEIPEGYQLAIVDGAPFRLYVPTTWTPNTQSGLSSAYFSMENKALVSADAIFTDESLEEYMTRTREGLAEGFADYRELAYKDALLGGAKAKRLEYEVTYGDVLYRILTLTAPHGAVTVTFTYSAPADVYDNYTEEVAGMIEVFAFGAMAVPPGEDKTDDKTPEGMKIAYGENAEYRFYIPTGWVLDTSTKFPSAYVSATDRSNISLTAYSPEISLSIDDYFALCEEDYKKTLTDYTLVESGERQIASRPGRYYVYTVRSGENEYRVMQAIVVSGEMFYSLTYTALASEYEVHLEDVERMIANFAFR